MTKLQKLVSAFAAAIMLFSGVMTAGIAAAQPISNQADSLGLAPIGESGLANTDIRVTIARIIRVAMGLLGIVAVVIILIGGFTWMTAGGNEEKVGEAKKWIFSGIIGLAIILSAYAIATFVITQLISATSGGSTSGITP